MQPGNGTYTVRCGQGLNFHCRIDGRDGAPWITTGNSHATDLSLWDDFVTEFESEYRILRYDLRGHGASSAPPPPYTMDHLVGDAIAILDHFRIGRVHFVGASIGGIIALGLALKHPGRLASFTVADSSAASDASKAKAWDERIAIARTKGVAALRESTLARWFAPLSLQARVPAIQKVGAMIETTSLDGYVGCANALQNYDFSRDLEAITLPCLLIAGAEDWPALTSIETLRQIPQARIAIIDQAGHLPAIEQPKTFNRVVREFLNKV